MVRLITVRPVSSSMARGAPAEPAVGVFRKWYVSSTSSCDVVGTSRPQGSDITFPGRLEEPQPIRWTKSIFAYVYIKSQ